MSTLPYDSDYSTLLDVFIRLVESQAGKKIAAEENWLNDAQVLAIKLFRHLTSIQLLSKGSTITIGKSTHIPFIDHASVKVIARAALETYLVFFYIYGSSDRDLCRFRHKTWHLAGLSDRQHQHATSLHSRAKLAHEKQQIEILQAEIEASTLFKTFTDRQRRKLIDGQWRIGKGWNDLGIDAGFHPNYFSNIYGYLCGYSHSSYASALQVGQAESIEDQEMLTKSILGIGMVLMAHFAFSYSRLFHEAGTVLAENLPAKQIAEKWQFGPEDMADLYNH